MTGRLFRRTMRFLSDPRGGVSAMLALMMIPLIGVFGMGAEASSWYLIQRAMQNTADSAAMAAASNGCAATATCHTTNLSATYADEATAVAKQFGFQNDAATVVATANVNCPGGTTPRCYQVTITRKIPVHLLRVVGFNGDTTLSGAPAQTVVASAIARTTTPPTGFCMMGLSNTGQALRINGGPSVDLSGCDLWSNSDLVCNGANSDTGVVNGYAHGTSSCGTNEVGGSPTLTDPYQSLSANPPIPTKTCGNVYPQGLAGPQLNSASVWTGGVLQACGDARLTSDITVTTANSILVVYNGHLDLNGHKLQTSGSGSLTIIFSGTPTSGGATTYHHYPMNSTGTGTIDIAAPSVGALHGIALMQDGRLNGNKNDLNMTYHGNDPTLNIQGLIYMPLGNFDMRGAINLHSGGVSCVAVIANTILVSGGGAIFDHATSDCVAAGATLPPVPGATVTRQALVQ